MLITRPNIHELNDTMFDTFDLVKPLSPWLTGVFGIAALNVTLMRLKENRYVTAWCPSSVQ